MIFILCIEGFTLTQSIYDFIKKSKIKAALFYKFVAFLECSGEFDGINQSSLSKAALRSFILVYPLMSGSLAILCASAIASSVV